MKKEYMKPTTLMVRIATPCRLFAVSQPVDVPWWDGEGDVHEFRGDFGSSGSDSGQGKGSLWDEEW